MYSKCFSKCFYSGHQVTLCKKRNHPMFTSYKLILSVSLMFSTDKIFLQHLFFTVQMLVSYLVGILDKEKNE